MYIVISDPLSSVYSWTCWPGFYWLSSFHPSNVAIRLRHLHPSRYSSGFPSCPNTLAAGLRASSPGRNTPVIRPTGPGNAAEQTALSFCHGVLNTSHLQLTLLSLGKHPHLQALHTCRACLYLPLSRLLSSPCPRGHIILPARTTQGRCSAHISDRCQAARCLLREKIKCV